MGVRALSYQPRTLVDESRVQLDEVRPRGKQVDEADAGSPLDLFEKAAQVGITDFMIPEEFGGGGFTDLFTQCLVQEQLCWGDLGIGNFLCSNGFFADPLLVLGIIGIILFAALMSAAIPLDANIQRNPIRDMRDEN